MLQRPGYKKFIFSFLLILCLFLSVTPVMADSAWNLALDGRILGGVPVRDNGRMTMVSIGVMGRLLQLKLEHKDDTLLIFYKNNKLQLVNKATAVWLDVQLVPMASAPVFEGGNWWLDSRSAIKILQALYQAAGSAASLSWAGDAVEASSLNKNVKNPEKKQDEAEAAILPASIPVVPSSTPASLVSSGGMRPCELKALRWGRYDDKIRAVFDYQGETEPQSSQTGQNVSIAFTEGSLSKTETLSPFPTDVLIETASSEGKYIITLSSIKGGELKVFTLPNPARLVVDIYNPKNEVLPAPVAVSNLKPAPKPVAEQASEPKEPVFVPAKVVPRKSAPLVVIDAGHGGKDPGAVANGYREKDLNLQYARQLAECVKKRGFRVRLTRDTDVYLKLGERTDLANKWEADMFISIHANALPKGRHANGTEIYIMALPTDKDAMELALIENRELTGDNGSESSAQVDKKTKMLLNILGNMQQNAKISDSTEVAEHLFKSGQKQKINMRRVAQAPFFVLRGATMPAVLIETGFLTERSEAKKLATPSFQKQFAEAIAQGVETYFNGR
ncbi:N-acetylmuramoyl-L-alanine amidase family protein [Aminobacterium colombiense]|jgi:N-acetylmuramoyl-L-alanine amidase|uniref:N-acetylmuramoyl-L-alanine amidase n=2 Tax=Aminobacterium TaxID=81466 RepID=D5ED05_AMICL|nr:N-acetylmuramoyl-L-alanine amidase [Aminobacterium colombiense]ADE56437.1 N-acetylmuramoyl-L-alanine amidase [Aminobacterium colombiense DSM 12261]